MAFEKVNSDDSFIAKRFSRQFTVIYKWVPLKRESEWQYFPERSVPLPFHWISSINVAWLQAIKILELVNTFEAFSKADCFAGEFWWHHNGRQLRRYSFIGTQLVGYLKGFRWEWCWGWRESLEVLTASRTNSNECQRGETHLPVYRITMRHPWQPFSHSRNGVGLITTIIFLSSFRKPPGNTHEPSEDKPSGIIIKN